MAEMFSPPSGQLRSQQRLRCHRSCLVSPALLQLQLKFTCVPPGCSLPFTRAGMIQAGRSWGAEPALHPPVRFYPTSLPASLGPALAWADSDHSPSSSSLLA